MRLGCNDESRQEAAMSPFRRRRATAAVLACGAALACVAVFAACGTTGSAAPSTSATAAADNPTPTPVPSPLITSGRPPAGAVDTVREFWRLVGQSRLTEAQDFLTTPDSPIRLWDGKDIAAARFVRVAPETVGKAPVAGATVEFAVDVWIKPTSGASAWGPAGVHLLFENVARMSDGSWRMVESGTGP